MASDDKKPDDRDTNFSFAERELRQANPAPTQPRAPRVRLETVEPVEEDRGADPYNTSGNFDRAKNWARVGRR